MAMRCENCNKGIMMGHRVSHAKNRTNHTFKPNLQKTKVMVNGKLVAAKLCTKCIKLFRKREKSRLTKIAEQQSATSTV